MDLSKLECVQNYKKWLLDGKHLPSFLKDFHDQKDLFKTIHGFLNMEKNVEASKVDWVTGHIYSIDIFLWFMGMHGYTLQKSRAKVDFRNLEETIEATKEKELAYLQKIFSSTVDKE